MAVFALLVVLVVAGTVVALGWLADRLLGQHLVGGMAPLILLLLVVAVAVTVARGFRRTMAPIGDLVEASARVEAGQLGTQVEERGGGEVRSLVRAFNAMSRRLAEGEQQRRQLLADVSHELRTPLTVIKGTLEGIRDGLYVADEERLERMQVETGRLEQLIEDLRTLSMADAGALALQLEPSHLAEIVRGVVSAFEPHAIGGGIALRVEAPTDPVDVEVDPRRMHQVVANLVSNALRHTPRGGEVIVAVTPAADAFTITVTDTGSGMSADDAAHAFDRFWRTGESSGSGLGLAIARDLVTAHAGTIELRSELGRGTTVTVRIPGESSER
jgi:signal transduction histidine kinase